jgi:hypothetical protein
MIYFILKNNFLYLEVLMKNIDILTVLFASIVYLIMYIVWYSDFLFGKIYKEISKKNIKKSILNYFFIFLFIFIISYVFALLEILLKVTTFWDGVFLGFLIWLGFIGTHFLFAVLSLKRNIKLYMIDNILYLLALMIVGGILAG